MGFGVPAVFAEGGTPDTSRLADIYEHVSFLEDLRPTDIDFACWEHDTSASRSKNQHALIR
jgi:hypothetical protein